VGALGCNLAWGIIDAILYLMGCLADKGGGLAALRAVRRATDPQKGRRLLADALPSVVTTLMEPAHLESLRERLARLPEPPARASLSRDDWRGAAEVFFLVFLSTFPVTIPFMVMRNAVPAMRVSNAVAIVLLFVTGYAFGRLTGHHPVIVGLSMVIVGLVLVGLTIALGG
jgi:VIT1/CCC1 family predicted Fe2+/Mn2+ transporter